MFGMFKHIKKFKQELKINAERRYEEANERWIQQEQQLTEEVQQTKEHLAAERGLRLQAEKHVAEERVCRLQAQWQHLQTWQELATERGFREQLERNLATERGRSEPSLGLAVAAVSMAFTVPKGGNVTDHWFHFRAAAAYLQWAILLMACFGCWAFTASSRRLYNKLKDAVEDVVEDVVGEGVHIGDMNA